MTKITALTALTAAQLDDVLPIADVHDTTMAASGTTKAITVGNLAAATQGLQFLTGGGTLTTAKIAAAQAAGFQGLFLDPRYVWDASGLVINGTQNFTIESRMAGSIGFSGHISYNTGGYITTGTGADGIQVYASAPSTTQTQGIIFKNCVLVGSNSNAVIHFGGGQRRCGLVGTLVYNTSSAVGAYGVVLDTALSDNNGEDNIFSFAGGGGLAGAYAALGIGTGNQTQSVNDTLWENLTTAGGTYSIVHTGGGNHTFTNYYDRSNPATAVVWNHGSGRLLFTGGEDQNSATSGLAHLIDVTGAQTLLHNRTVTKVTNATTVQVSAGAVVLRGACGFNAAQTVALSGTGVVDLADPAITAGNATISGSAGTLMLANNYAGPGGAPVLTSWTGTTAYQGPIVAQSAAANSQTTTQTVTWTPPAVNARFRVSVWVRVQTAGTSTVPNLAFTGFSGGTVSANLPMWKLDGAATAPTYLCAATGDYVTELTSETDASGTAVTVTITPTGSTFRYSVVIERLT